MGDALDEMHGRMPCSSIYSMGWSIRKKTTWVLGICMKLKATETGAAE